MTDAEYNFITIFNAWYRAAKPEERRQVAAAAGTSAEYLRAIKGGHRAPKMGLALRLTAAITEIQNPGAADTVLCPCCGSPVDIKNLSLIVAAE